MAKKKRGNKGPKMASTYQDKNEFHDGLDLEGADAYEAVQDEKIQLKMDKLQNRNKLKDASGGFEELYALSGDSDSEMEEVEGVEFADEENDEESDVRAWGNKKKHFYGGNPSDKRYGEERKDEELEEDEAEEEEGKLLQQKQLEKLDDEDFFDMFTPSNQVKKVEEKVNFDITQLSKKERVALFEKESPEFKSILADFHDKMNEVKEFCQPLIDLANDGKISNDSPAMDFVRTKYKLTLTYCVNILTYVMFKTKNVNLKLHPLTKRLVQFKQMLNEMSQMDQVLKAQFEDLMQNPEEIEEEIPVKKKGTKKKLKVLSKKSSEIEAEKPSQPEDLTMDEKIALEVYEAMKSKKNVDENMESEPESETENVQDENEESEERRAITYQIAKNKGLQPKRNKIQRNPRVKHRKKFEKAKVRRKGQVREVRTEVKRYAGEVSGINMRVKKGVKLS